MPWAADRNTGGGSGPLSEHARATETLLRQLVESRRNGRSTDETWAAKADELMRNNVPVCVDVVFDAPGKPPILLETWRLRRLHVPGDTPPAAQHGIDFLTQSLSSFLHYSPFHFWLSRTPEGGFTSSLRVCPPEESMRATTGAFASGTRQVDFKPLWVPNAEQATIALDVEYRIDAPVLISSLWKAQGATLGEKRGRSPAASPVRRCKSATMPADTPDLGGAGGASGASRGISCPPRLLIQQDRPGPPRARLGPGSPDPRKRMLRGGGGVGPHTAPVCIPRSSSLRREGTVTSPPAADIRLAPLRSGSGSLDRNGPRPRSLSVGRLLTPPHSSGAKRLLGSFEESLLTGRMSNSASTYVQGFMVQLGASGAGKTPPKITVPLAASFYCVPGDWAPSPYVGVIDLVADPLNFPGGRYRIPAKGLVQLMIYNPEKTGIKVFAVPYNFADMPSKTHTFLRQRTFAQERSAPADGKARRLAYAVHLRFSCSRKGRVYLHKEIRVLFSHRTPDRTERLTTITEGPMHPVFSPDVKSHAFVPFTEQCNPGSQPPPPPQGVAGSSGGQTQGRRDRPAPCMPVMHR